MNVRLCQYDGTNVKLFVFPGSCSSETIRKLQFPLDKVQTTEICMNLHVAKINRKICIFYSIFQKFRSCKMYFYSFLKVWRLLQDSQYYLDYYVPSMLLVSMSWVSFWLEPSAIPGRTTLGEARPETPWPGWLEILQGRAAGWLTSICTKA